MFKRLIQKAVLPAAVLVCFSPPFTTATPVNVRDAPFSWDQLQPSTSLEWVPCYNIFNCTQFEVPLNYSDANAGTTNIAFVKYAAEQNSETAQSIVINGGGPGEGIEFLTNNYASFRTLFGPQYNVVVFDPRGVGYSGPVVNCIGPDNASMKQSWAQEFYRDVATSSNVSLATQYESAQVYAAWCSQALSKNESMKYISTPAVATDMLSFARAEATAAGKSRDEIDQVKVFYYAISYGTVIGATFASLYPNNIGRLMIDGVVDDTDYYTTSYSQAVLDADAALLSFSRYCFEAGPTNCSFWGPSEQNITDRFDAIFSSLHYSPIANSGLDGSGGMPGLATYADLLYLTIYSLYRTRDYFPILSDAFYLLEQGNGSAIAEYWQTLAAPGAIPDANFLIMCVDGYGKSQASRSTFEDYAAYVSLLAQESKYLGPVLPTFTGLEICSFLDIPSLQSQVNGSFGMPLPPSAMNTSYPLLIGSSLFDPVTPLSSAQNAQTHFPGSSLLVQNATGHSGTYSASACFIEAVQSYFNGSLEANSSTVCQEDIKPFQGVPGFIQD